MFLLHCYFSSLLYAYECTAYFVALRLPLGHCYDLSKSQKELVEENELNLIIQKQNVYENMYAILGIM